jgi:hypothetical protein
MRSLLALALSGMVLTASAAAAQTPASGVGPRPSYNMQHAGEDIGPFAGGAKIHRAPAGRTVAHGKAHKGDQAH